MKISKIHTIHLRNDEHFQFHTEFRDLAAKETPQKLKIQQQFEAYQPLYGRKDEALKKNNTAFAELMRERVDEGSLKVDIVLKKARVHLDEAYYSIVERVNALAVVEGVADYEPFIRKMNINVAKFSLLMPVRKKQGKRGGGKNSTNGGSHEN